MFPSIELKTAFLRFSQTTEGVLTTAELRDLLQSLSYDTRSPSLREMLDHVDKEGETKQCCVLPPDGSSEVEHVCKFKFCADFRIFHEHSDQSVIDYSMVACLYQSILIRHFYSATHVKTVHLLVIYI